MVIGAAHALAIVCSLASLHASLLDSRTSKYRLGTSDRRRHVAAAVLAGVALLVLALQLNARLAAHALPLVHGAAAPFEWAAYTLAALSWALLVALFATHARAFAPASSPALWRFPPFLVLTGNLAKLRFVLQSEERSDYFAALFYAYVGLQVALCLLLLWLAPDGRKMVLVEQGTGPDPDTAAYLVGGLEESGLPNADAGVLWNSPSDACLVTMRGTWGKFIWQEPAARLHLRQIIGSASPGLPSSPRLCVFLPIMEAPNPSSPSHARPPMAAAA